MTRIDNFGIELRTTGAAEEKVFHVQIDEIFLRSASLPVVDTGTVEGTDTGTVEGTDTGLHGGDAG